MTMMLMITTALALTAGAALGAEPKTKAALPESDPAKCFLFVPEGQITVGQAIELCSGTTDWVKTLKCFNEAFGTPAEGGLGLNLGQAVNLCSANPAWSR